MGGVAVDVGDPPEGDPFRVGLDRAAERVEPKSIGLLLGRGILAALDGFLQLCNQLGHSGHLAARKCVIIGVAEAICPDLVHKVSVEPVNGLANQPTCDMAT